MNHEPILRRKISHEVVQRLSQRIRAGEWPAGAQLPSERDLMDTYGVGRPAVREALQDLARSGIVEITHGERARVVVPTADLLMAQIAGGAQHLLRMDPSTLEHIKGARVFLEVGLCTLAAEKATEPDKARLLARWQDHVAALNDMDQFLHRDMLFHREIAIVCGNPIFPAIVEALFNWAGEHSQHIVRAPGAEQLTLQEHRRIYEAIAAGDSAAAAQAMKDHLLRADVLYRQPTASPMQG